MALSILDGNQSATTLSTILSSGQHITAHTVVSLGTQAITDMRGAVSGSVVSISNFPASQVISGTVTANPTGTQTIAGTVTANGRSDIYDGANDVYYNKSVIAWGNPFIGEPTLVEQSTPLPIAGTVTARLDGNANYVKITDTNGDDIFLSNGNLPISGTVTANPTGTQTIAGSVTLGAGTAQIGSVTASISNSVTIASLPAISGTVTANSSNGSLTTRFGSVTTANTAFATSAVTNANRKYLLIQNVTTASNVITVGIGFTPTTTQGIQLSSGAGLTFEGSYIPTGAVNLLSSVTASCFTILEA